MDCIKGDSIWRKPFWSEVARVQKVRRRRSEGAAIAPIGGRSFSDASVRTARSLVVTGTENRRILLEKRKREAQKMAMLGLVSNDFAIVS